MGQYGKTNGKIFMMTLDEYTKMAQRLICKLIGSRYLTDDNIGLVVNYLVYADNHFDETKGKLTNFL